MKGAFKMNTTIRTILVTVALGLSFGCSATAANAAVSGPDAVRCVQKQLNALGFDVGVADGVVGVKTFLASEAYTRFLGANGEGGAVRTPLSVRSAREWCEMVAGDYPKVAPYWEALQESEMPADPKAIFDLAYGFDTGIGAKKNEALAVRWYLKAANLGYAPAQRNLAGMYGSGRGVAMNVSFARYWFTEAASQGDAQAQFVLGKTYTADPQASIAWLWKAAKQGHRGAISELELRLHI
jgi:TPR repeat protein